jgi:hypothetical protein
MKTNFNPETDGFGFANDWDFEGFELQLLRDAVAGGLAAATVTLSPTIIALSGPALLAVAGLAGPFATLALPVLATAAAKAALDGIVNAVVNKGYGLCGGMAYAALDYYRLNWVVNGGGGVGHDDQPHRLTDKGTNESETLRSYIWSRLIDSLVNDNAATVLDYIATLQLPGGDHTILDRSKAEFEKIKQHLDQGEPWPVGLVGTSLNPFEGHQVLAIDYSDPGNGKPTLTVYDSNGPGLWSDIAFDFTGQSLQTTKDDTRDNLKDDTARSARGPLKGIFCETYSFKTPPVAVGITAGLSGQPSCVEVGEQEQVAFTATNIGYGPTFRIRLLVQGTASGYDGDVGNHSIAIGASRTLALGLTFPTAGSRLLVAACQLVDRAGTAVWKTLPLLPGGASITLPVKVMPHLEITAVPPHCTPPYVEGGTTKFKVDVMPFGGGNLTYQWSVQGAAAVGANNTAMFTIGPLPAAGEAVVVSVTVHDGAGCHASGTITFTPISMQPAEMQRGLCDLIDKIRKLPDFLPPGDPARQPELVSLDNLRQIHDLATNVAAASQRVLELAPRGLQSVGINTVGFSAIELVNAGFKASDLKAFDLKLQG